MKLNKKRIGLIIFRIILVAVGVYSLPLFLIPLSLSVGVNIGNFDCVWAVFYSHKQRNRNMPKA